MTSTASAADVPPPETSVEVRNRLVDALRLDLVGPWSGRPFERAFGAVRQIVEMPDRRASLFVRLCMQNGGRLSARKRRQFSELSDEEVSAMETQVRVAMESVVPDNQPRRVT